MARTAIAVTDLAQHGAAVTENLAAADVANGNMLDLSGGDIVLVMENTGGSPYTVTFTAVPDNLGRTPQAGVDNVVSLSAGQRKFWHCKAEGWAQISGADKGSLYINASNTAVQLQAIRLPRFA